MVKVECEICKKQHLIPNNRIKTYKTCSYECSSIRRTKVRESNAVCTHCSTPFFLKIYKLNKVKLGTFCSATCSSAFKATYFLGKNNPNYRAKMYDYDGYLLAHIPKVGRVTIHRYVTMKYLGLTGIPKGYHVHHRDCNVHNNQIENLAVLNVKDHQWLHKQFGSATLWAFIHGKVQLQDLVAWSNDSDRAQILLTTNLTNQIGVFKPCELLESPTSVRGDNQQPSTVEIQ
jgi:hypothetical protein